MKKAVKKQRRRPQQARALQKYNTLLDTCSQVLARNGYANTSITELSLESDLPYSTIYQYFENKDDILIAWFERLIDQLYDQLTLSHSLTESNNMSHYVETLVEAALTIISFHRVSIKEMISGMPQMNTSRILNILEEKTVRLINKLFVQEIKQLNYPNLDYNLGLLTKMVIGYILQMVFHENETIDIEKDSNEVSLLINVYLKEKGLIN